MKKLILISIIAAAAGAQAQTLPLQVINAAGKTHEPVNGIILTDNVGEAFVTTISSGDLMVTQGFLQADDDVIIIEVGGVKIFNGVTPNNDGRNDKWTIQGIEEFPDNSVVIFNRWGMKVFSVAKYDNEAVVWPTNEQVSNLPSGTYFYIVDLGNGSKAIKGWVELIKN